MKASELMAILSQYLSQGIDPEIISGDYEEAVKRGDYSSAGYQEFIDEQTESPLLFIGDTSF